MRYSYEKIQTLAKYFISRFTFIKQPSGLLQRRNCSLVRFIRITFIDSHQRSRGIRAETESRVEISLLLMERGYTYACLICMKCDSKWCRWISSRRSGSDEKKRQFNFTAQYAAVIFTRFALHNHGTICK